jgi:hypothetical protein
VLREKIMLHMMMCGNQRGGQHSRVPMRGRLWVPLLIGQGQVGAVTELCRSVAAQCVQPRATVFLLVAACVCGEGHVPNAEASLALVVGGVLRPTGPQPCRRTYTNSRLM